MPYLSGQEVQAIGGAELEGDPRVLDAMRIAARQAGCSMDEAVELMRNMADLTNETLKFVAGEVIAGRVRFDPPN